MVIPKEIVNQLMEICNAKCVINSEKLEQIISTGEIEQYKVLDIRERELFQKYRFPNSINIPFKELGKNMERLPIDKKILLICNSGFTAAQSLSLLNSIGFKTFILENGINGYLEEGRNARNNILRTA
ncbi:MAG: rhodanese-like domain-containing protein [Peptococcaceae bacterium]